jgi:hypothetical protein
MKRRSSRVMGRIVSPTLQSDESVCIACGQPICEDHIGLQTVQSLREDFCAAKVASGTLDPNWKKWQLLAVKDLLKRGVKCTTALEMIMSLAGDSSLH